MAEHPRQTSCDLTYRSHLLVFSKWIRGGETVEMHSKAMIYFQKQRQNTFLMVVVLKFTDSGYLRIPLNKAIY